MSLRATFDSGMDPLRLATTLSSRRYRTSVFQSIKRLTFQLWSSSFVGGAAVSASSSVLERVNSPESSSVAKGCTQKVENIPLPLRLTLSSRAVTQFCFPPAISRSAVSFVAWIRFAWPLDSILDAVLTVSPKLKANNGC